MTPPRDNARSRRSAFGAKLCASVALAALLSSAPAHAQKSAIQLTLDRMGAKLTATTGSKPTTAVLDIARKFAQTGEESERGAALLLLGLAQQSADLDLLSKTSEGGPPAIRDRATIALGMLGSTAGRHELERRLAERGRGDAEKAVIAFAIGLSGNGEESNSTLKLHALKVLRRSRDRHQEQLAACLASMPVDEGRSVLEHVLSLRADRLIGGSTGRRRAVNSGVVERLATAALAMRFATDSEWVMVRQALSRNDDEAMRRVAVHGILQRGPDGLKAKLKKKIARDLERRLRDPSMPVAGLAMLALAEFDQKIALRRARIITDLDRRRPPVLDAAFLVLGKHGSKRDIKRMQRWQSRAKEPEAHAAWAIAAAQLARRVDGSSFPPEPTKTPAFPIPALRASIRESNHQHPLIRTASALALARLGDRQSGDDVRSLFFAYAKGRHSRLLATAAMHLDIHALDVRRGESLDDQRIIGWGLVGTPRIWTPLEEALTEPGIAPERRTALLTIAALSAAGPRGDLESRMRRRVGSMSSLPTTLRNIAGWLDAGRAKAMMARR